MTCSYRPHAWPGPAADCAPDPRRAAWRALAAWAAGLMACMAVAGAAAQPLAIGSKRFTESYILAELMAQAVASAAPAPVVKAGLGNTAIVYQALQGGAVDLYPDYTGTIAQEILKMPGAGPEAMRAALAARGLGMAIPFGFDDGYALAVRAGDAGRAGIAAISDLAAHPELRFGLSNEFLGRADGWRGLSARYGLHTQPAGLDHGLAYDALARGQVDVIDVYTTDARLRDPAVRVLRDDRGYFPRYDAVVLYRLDVPRRFPDAWRALQGLAGRVDERAMIGMNARAELDGVGFERIDRDFLAGGDPPAAAGGGAAVPTFWSRLWGPDLGRLAVRHVWLVLASVGLAALLAVPAGVALSLRPRARRAALAAVALLQTVPALAMLAVLIWLLGSIGVLPAVAALTLYALLPILGNTCAGLGDVAGGQRAAALALGLRTWQSLLWVELPQALPAIVGGLRIATSIGIGTATIAAFIGAGGFGERIVTGLALNDSGLLLAGALPAAALALVSECLFELWLRALRRR